LIPLLLNESLCVPWDDNSLSTIPFVATRFYEKWNVDVNCKYKWEAIFIYKKSKIFYKVILKSLEKSANNKEDEIFMISSWIFTISVDFFLHIICDSKRSFFVIIFICHSSIFEALAKQLVFQWRYLKRKERKIVCEYKSCYMYRSICRTHNWKILKILLMKFFLFLLIFFLFLLIVCQWHSFAQLNLNKKDSLLSSP
jgi:hypothetical protein